MRVRFKGMHILESNLTCFLAEIYMRRSMPYVVCLSRTNTEVQKRQVVVWGLLASY